MDRRRFLTTAAAGALTIPGILRGETARAATPSNKLPMKIQRIGSQPSSKGPADWFTGSVRVDMLFPAEVPPWVSAANVTFEPGARTAWHTLGQHLAITCGVGRVQQEGGPIQEIRPGDVVQFPPGVKHWHGTAPATAMTHIAIQEALDGKAVHWLEKLSDERYGK